MAAPPRRRGPGPRLTTSFKYKLRHPVPTNLSDSPTCACDNLVSRGHNFLPTMSTTSVVGSGVSKADEEVTLVDIAHRLSAIEEIIRPLQLVLDEVATLEGTVHDQGQ
jgi:hypothetical protein